MMSCRESRGPASSWPLLVVVYESLVVSREVETASGDETSGEVDLGGGAFEEWSVCTLAGGARVLPCAGVHGERLGRPELATEGDDVIGLGELHETEEDFGHKAAGLRGLREALEVCVQASLCSPASLSPNFLESKERGERVEESAVLDVAM